MTLDAVKEAVQSMIEKQTGNPNEGFLLKHKPTLGLALSGGGARGLAHIGVLKVLEAEGIKVDCIAGTSMGGMVAAFYASGLSPADIEAEAIRMGRLKQMLRLVDVSRIDRSLLGGDSVRQYLVQQLGADLTFADLQLPVTLNAVDLLQGKEVVFTTGSVVDAIRATTAVPGVFDPVEIEGLHLIDGGILNNLPANHARTLGAEVIVAVNVSASAYALRRIRQEGKSAGAVQTLLTSEAIMVATLTERQLQLSRPELILYPGIPEGVMPLRGFTRAAEIIAAGEKAAYEAIPRLKELLKPRSQLLHQITHWLDNHVN